MDRVYTTPSQLFFFNFVRALCRILIKLLFKVRVSGEENIPIDGACILASNHITYVDWAIISSKSPRPIRFTMFTGFFLKPIRWFLKLAQVVPICSKESNPTIYYQAFDQISDHLDKGRLVCLFPEGSLTTDGEMHQFKHGIDKILKRNPVPVVPVYLSYELWGHWLSKSNEPYQVWKRPLVRVIFGKKMEPGMANAHSLETVIRLLKS